MLRPVALVETDYKITLFYLTNLRPSMMHLFFLSLCCTVPDSGRSHPWSCGCTDLVPMLRSALPTNQHKRHVGIYPPVNTRGSETGRQPLSLDRALHQHLFFPCAVNATTHHCTLAPLQQHPQLPPVSRPSVNHQPKTIETLLHICMAWNKGVCKHVNCTFRHFCATCQQLHKARDCPTTPADSKYKLIALLSSKPSVPQRMISSTRL